MHWMLTCDKNESLLLLLTMPWDHTLIVYVKHTYSQVCTDRHIQVGSSDAQISAHVHSLRAWPNLETCPQPNSTFTCKPAAGPTVHQDGLFQACFPVFSTVCLELAATDSSDQWLCLFLNPDLKLLCSIRLILNTDPTCHQRLWSYDLLYKFCYYCYYYMSFRTFLLVLPPQHLVNVLCATSVTCWLSVMFLHFPGQW